MNPIALFVEPIAAWIFAVAQVFGGNVGAGVIVVSVGARLLMLPFSLELARRSLKHREAMETIRPELKKLQKRWRNKPERLSRESAALFERQGIQPIDGGGLLGGLLQAPVFLALWTAARQVSQVGGRFMWIADLARPDVLLTLLAAALAGAGAAAGVQSAEVSRTWIFLLPAILTCIFLWKASAGVGLYWASSSLVSVIQGGILRRESQRANSEGA